jgi:hypothetical protein
VFSTSWTLNKATTNIAVMDCNNMAYSNGDKYFAVGAGGTCYTGSTSYNLYGTSSLCQACSSTETVGMGGASAYCGASSSTKTAIAVYGAVNSNGKGSDTGSVTTLPPPCAQLPCTSTFCWQCASCTSTAKCYYQGTTYVSSFFCSGSAPSCS